MKARDVGRSSNPFDLVLPSPCLLVASARATNGGKCVNTVARSAGEGAERSEAGEGQQAASERICYNVSSAA